MIQINHVQISYKGFNIQVITDFDDDDGVRHSVPVEELERRIAEAKALADSFTCV